MIWGNWVPSFEIDISKKSAVDITPVEHTLVHGTLNRPRPSMELHYLRFYPHLQRYLSEILEKTVHQNIDLNFPIYILAQASSAY